MAEPNQNLTGFTRSTLTPRFCVPRPRPFVCLFVGPQAAGEPLGMSAQAKRAEQALIGFEDIRVDPSGPPQPPQKKRARAHSRMRGSHARQTAGTRGNMAVLKPDHGLRPRHFSIHTAARLAMG